MNSAETEEMQEQIGLVIIVLELEAVCITVLLHVCVSCFYVCVCLCSDLCFTVQQHDWHPLQGSKNSAPSERGMCHFQLFG